MTVAELMKKLAELPPEMQVRIMDYEWGHLIAGDVRTVNGYLLIEEGEE